MTYDKNINKIKRSRVCFQMSYVRKGYHVNLSFMYMIKCALFIRWVFSLLIENTFIQHRVPANCIALDIMT